MSPEPVEPVNVDPDVDLAKPPHWHRDAGGRAFADTWRTVSVVAAGGGLGGLARLGLNTALPRPAGGFPWATFTENVLGSLLIGVLLVLVLEVWASRPRLRYLRPFLGTGVLGGFTTFSAYTSDTRALLASGHSGVALLYLFGSLGAGLLAVVVGLALTRAAVASGAARSPR